MDVITGPTESRWDFHELALLGLCSRVGGFIVFTRSDAVVALG